METRTYFVQDMNGRWAWYTANYNAKVCLGSFVKFATTMVFTVDFTHIYVVKDRNQLFDQKSYDGRISKEDFMAKLGFDPNNIPKLEFISIIGHGHIEEIAAVCEKNRFYCGPSQNLTLGHP